MKFLDKFLLICFFNSEKDRPVLYVLLSSFLGWRRGCFALGSIPFFNKPPCDFLLLPNGKICIFGVSCSISSLNKGNRVLGASNLGKDHLTFLQTPSGLNGILWMRGKPEIVFV